MSCDPASPYRGGESVSNPRLQGEALHKPSVLQVSAFNPSDGEAGGPVRVVRRLSTSNPWYESIGIVAPSFKGSAYEDTPVISCRKFAQYRSVALTTVEPLRRAVCGADLVAIHGYRHWLAHWGAYFARTVGKPYVIICHGTAWRGFRSRLKKRFYDWVAGSRDLEEAQAVCVSSRREAEEVIQLCRSPKVVIVPNGVDRPHCADGQPSKWYWLGKLGLPAGSRIVLAVGRINPTKNYLPGIRLLMKDPQWCLVVAGPVEIRSYLNRLLRSARECGVADRVRFLGGVYGEELDSLYRAADVLLCTSLVESFGNTILEALSCGIPVVMPRWVGVAEQLCTQSALVVETLGVDELACAVRAALAKGGEPTGVSARLTWESVVAQYGRLFTQIVTRPTEEDGAGAQGD